MSEEKKKVQSYENDQIQVGFDPNVCIHAAKCVGGLPGVFNIKNRPWINVDGASAEALASQIQQCPSGALTYKMKQ